MSRPEKMGALPKAPMASPANYAMEGGPQPMSGAATNVGSGGEKQGPNKKRWNRNKRQEKMKLQREMPVVRAADQEMLESVKILSENFHTVKPVPSLVVVRDVARVQPLLAQYVEKPYPASLLPASLHPGTACEPHQYTPPALAGPDKYRCDTHLVEVLQTRHLKHPRAQFRCKLCSYFCDNMAVVDKHINENRHKDALTEHRLVVTVAKMPRLGQGQVLCLDEFVKSNYTANGLSSEDREVRREIARRVNDLVQECLPGVSIRLYGSSETCMGLKCSDVNLGLVVPAADQRGPAKVMLAVAAMLRQCQSSSLTVQECNLKADLPAIVVRDKSSNLSCVIALSSEPSFQVTQLLACYESIDHRVKPLAAIFRMWAKLCGVDQTEAGTWPPHAFALLLVYYLQQMACPVLPVLQQLVPNPDKKPELYLDPSELDGVWQTKNTMSLGQLWVNLFRFYAHDFAVGERVVCIQQLEPLLRATKKWTGRKLAIEDPFICRRNVSKSIVNMVSFNFILHCFRTTYLYFAIPQLPSGPLFGYVRDPLDPAAYGPELEVMLRAKRDWNEPRLRGQSFPELEVTPQVAQEMCSQFSPELMCLEAKRQHFWGNKVLPMVCILCSQEGHVRGQCPEQVLPLPVALPPMTEQMVNYLTELCTSTFRLLSPTREEVSFRQGIVKGIEAFLNESDAAIKLELFGSSCNGFGLVRSDLDICLTFRDNATGESLNFASIIEQTMQKCRKYREMSNLVAITTAKVPILKFVTASPANLEGDISVYNTLAQRNTKLLRAYADLDVRARMLGFMMKKFAKMCDICDASRGSLSSYAYILMVIYFLQQCSPPVLPVLQQLCEGEAVPAPVMVDGCNTYFYEDVASIRNVWPGLGRNTTPVGLLWHQMLCFYAQHFPFNTDVISIRQLDKLSRFEKLWNTKSVAIEDPFDLTHNLGAGLSIKMHTFIMKTLLRGRQHFGTSVELPACVPLVDYFFDRRKLMDGVPPNDRGCRVCKKIGHQAKDCPSKKSELKQQQQQQQHRRPVNNQQQRNQRGPPQGGGWKNENVRYAPARPPPLLPHPAARGGHMAYRPAHVDRGAHNFVLPQREIDRLEQRRQINMMTAKVNMAQRNNW